MRIHTLLHNYTTISYSHFVFAFISQSSIQQVLCLFKAVMVGYLAEYLNG